jgi:HEAT repeat protein
MLTNQGDRLAAIYWLGDKGSVAKSATPELLEVINSDEDPLIRKSAIIALGKIGDPGAVQFLTARIKELSKNDEERRLAESALQKIWLRRVKLSKKPLLMPTS